MPKYVRADPEPESIRRAERFVLEDFDLDHETYLQLGGFSNYYQCFVHAFALGWDARGRESAQEGHHTESGTQL